MTPRSPSPRTYVSMLLPLLPLALLAAGCSRGDGPEPSRTVRDSSGVILVEAPAEERPLSWTAERVLTLEPLEEEGAGFFSVAGVAVLEGQRIAVLDRDGSRVVLYEESGRHLTQTGRRGSGPGEFQFPVNLMPLGNGGVAVFDMMNRRIDLFDASLELEGTDPLTGIAYYGDGMALVGDVTVFSGADPTTPGAQLLIAAGPADTTEFVRHERVVGGAVTLESCGMRLGGIEPIFSPGTSWAVGPGGVVAVAGTERYEIDVHRAPDFTLERRIRRAVPVVQATQASAVATVGEGMQVMTPTGRRTCDAREVVEKRGFAPTIPPITRVAVSPSGDIFLARWAPPGEGASVDVLSLEGDYRGTLASPFPFPDAFLGGDRIAVVEEDDLGLESVAVYAIRR